MSAQALFEKLQGKWEGNCRTWLRPDELADESTVKGEFQQVIDSAFLRHRYEGSFQGKPRRGEDTLAFNSVTQKYQSSWMDDFHTSNAILFSEGDASENGFSVRCEYAVAKGQPAWGWRTEFQIVNDDQLKITAYNIHPEGMEGKAVEIDYRRVK